MNDVIDKFNFLSNLQVKHILITLSLLLQKIVKGELLLKERITKQAKHWHDEHSCEFFYTCAIDTNNIQRVLNGCRTLIVQNHLRRYGII